MQEDLLRFDKKKLFVFMDKETENLCLNFEHNLPWQVALLKTVGNTKIDSRDFHLKWDMRPIKLSEQAAVVTKFNRREYESKAVPEEEAFKVYYEWLEEADYIIGHNILGFDIYLLKEWYKKHEKPYKHLLAKFIDTSAIDKAIQLGIKYDPKESLIEFQYKLHHKVQKGLKTSLLFLGKKYNIDHDYDNLHNALIDLELNFKVWNKQKILIDI